MYLHRLIYYSENKIRELGLPLAKEIKAIIAAGHRNNPAAGLTGVLGFNEQYFVGVLEGDRRRISSAFVRIAGDKRNANPTIIQSGPIEERRFDDWLSVYAGHSDAVDKVYLRFGLTQGLDPARTSSASMLMLLEALCRLDPRSLAPQVASAPEQIEVIKVSPVMS